MRSCPSREELRRLLADELTGPEFAVIQRHVDGCPVCQECLETLTSPAAELSPLPVSERAPSEGKDRSQNDPARAPRQDFLDRLMAQGPSADTQAPLAADAASRGTAEAAWPTIPGYEILGVLGRGGMGLVYRARDVRLNRHVALKMIAVHANPEQRARFHREAEAAARLQHPHIVQVYEVGEHEGRPYLMLELVEGGSLAEKLQSTPQPARPAAELVLTLARAMHYAHQQGIIHRDLKPANILLASVAPRPLSVAPEKDPLGPGYGLRTTDYGLPKIADFGLAKLQDLNQAQTQSGLILGTPSYMAPEQAAGSAREIGPAADIYALGVILYEMLTGRPPFRGDTPLETLQQVVSEEPVAPSRLRPKLPRDLQTICLKCLEKEPHQRYASAAALAEDLRRFLADEPIQARSVSQRERLWRWCRRNPRLALMTAVVAILLLVVAGGSSLAAIWLRDERDTAQANMGRAVSAEQDATEKLRQSYLAQARAGRLSGLAGQGYGGLELIEQAIALRGAEQLAPDQILELRNEAIACLALPDLRLVRQQDSGGAYWLGGETFDPLLERYTYLDSRDRHLVVRRFSDNEVLARLPPPTNLRFWFTNAWFSPDGRFLVAHYTANRGGQHQNVVWDLSTGKRLLQVPNSGAVGFSADSHTLAVILVDGGIALYPVPECQEPKRLGQGLSNLWALCFDPAGHRLACAGEEPLHILDIATGLELAKFANEGTVWVDWSPDGRWLAIACEDRCVYVYDAIQLRLQSVLKGHEASVRAVAFSRANLLASWSWDGTTRLWDPVSGKPWLSTAGSSIHFSPDGQRLSFCQQPTTFGVWEVAQRQVCRQLHHGQAGNQKSSVTNSGLTSVDFSADGRLLASAGSDGIRLWDTATALEAAHLAVGQAMSVSFDPQGDGLWTCGQAGLLHWPVQTRDPQKPDGVAAAGESSAERTGPGAARSALGAPRSSFQVGPPRTLFQSFGRDDNLGAAWDREGTRLAVTDKRLNRALVLHADSSSRLVELADRYRIISIALSPDGKWAAAAAWQDPRVKVWEADTGLTAAMLPGTGPEDHVFSAFFSPDNQWLVTGNAKDIRWWQVGSWQAGPRITMSQWIGPGIGHLAFARDIPLLAVTATGRTIKLLDPSTGHEWATLTPPDRHMVSWLCFSRDGSELAAATQDGIIQLWDLRALRQELAARHLDWDLPPYPPTKDSSVQPIHVRVEPADAAAWKAANDPARLRFQVGLASFLLALNPFHVEACLQRAEAYARLGELDRARVDYRLALTLLPPGNQQRIARFAAAGTQPEDYVGQRKQLEQALKKDPENPRLCNNLAWSYVTGPADLRAPDKALPLARKAVAREPGIMSRNTLGVVCYRLGRYQEAVDCFEQNLHENKQYAVFDLFFLAMSYHRLNEPAKAQDCYEQAKQGWQKQSNLTTQQVEELKSFQAEAEAVMKEAKP